MHDRHTSLLSLVQQRVTKRIPSLLNLLGIVCIISGIVGLLFIQAPLSQTTEQRSKAAHENGAVETTFSPNAGSQLTYDLATQQPATVDVKLNTHGLQVNSLQYVFNIVGPALSPAPEIAINPDLGLQNNVEVQQVADGYFAVVSLFPEPGGMFSTAQETTIFSLNLKATTNSSVSLSFDQQNTFASVFDGTNYADAMNLVPAITYPVVLVQPVLPGTYPINWNTGHVSLQASDFTILANGQSFVVTDAGVDSLHSDPPSDPTDDYTTLEAMWTQNGIPMRLFMYIYKDAQKWTVEEMRIYNGAQPGDWIFFPNPVIASGPRAGQKLSAPIGQPFIQSGETTFNSTNNGAGKITFTDLQMSAFLPTDDLFFVSSAWSTSFTDTNGQAVSASNLEIGKTYKATVQFAVDSTSTTSKVENENVVVRVGVAGQTVAQQDVGVNYSQLSQQSGGAVGTATQLSFVAASSNAVSAVIDPTNSYAETNENNNYYSTTVGAAVGGITTKQCNELCSTNEECPVNQRCYDTGTDKRCRLVSYVTSEGCQEPSAGSLSCNQLCTYSSQCSSGLSCVSGYCRNPLNAGSTTCANPGSSSSTTSTTVTKKSCNQSCANTSECAAGLLCSSGKCRLVGNPSSTSCSAATSTTATSQYAQKGGDVSASPSTSATPTPSPVMEKPPAYEYKPGSTSTNSATTSEPELSLPERIKQLLGETGTLASAVIGAGALFLLVSFLWALLAGRKRSAPLPPAPVVKENEVKPLSKTSLHPASMSVSSVPPTAPAQHAFGSATVPHFEKNEPVFTAQPPSSLSTSQSASQPGPVNSGEKPVPVEEITRPESTPATPSSMLSRVKEKGIEVPK